MLYKKSLTREVLFMVASGTLLLSSLFAPNVAQLLKPLMRWRKNWDKIDRRRIYDAIKRLNNKKLIELVEKGNDMYLKITVAGKDFLRRFDYDDLELLKSNKWDGKWRLIIFDIPEKKKKERLALSKKLKDLGVYPLQKSVFIYPYDCSDEIDFICEFLSINHYVNYCVIESLGKKEGDLRRFFNIL